MSKQKRILSMLLAVLTVVAALFCTNNFVSAQSSIGIVTGVSVALRSAPDTNPGTKVYLRLNTGNEVEIISNVTGSQAEAGHGTDWYKVRYNGQEGYIYGYYIRLKTVDGDFETLLARFPESYKPYLRVLHNIYPNYKFIPDELKMSFDEAVNAEYNRMIKMAPIGWPVNGDERWYSPQPEAFNDDGTRKIADGNSWYYASRTAIAYFMDPRNFLSGTDIYMFAEQGYDSKTQTSDILRTVIKDTFLEKGYDNNPDAYINDIMEAAEISKVNPCVLAATIIIEQGTKGTSGLISGTYSGFEGYYNFFNIGAYGSGIDTVIVSGLTKAKEKGWNTRRLSIIGGAQTYADGYISRGQDTYYYKNFNVVSAPYYSHQYAGNLWDSKNNASRFARAFAENTSGALTFKIPVYTSIPDTVSIKPDQSSNPDPAPTPDPTPAPDPTPPPSGTTGDVNGDGAIDIVDLAAMKFHILGRQQLSGDAFSRADINKDGVIDVVDLAAVKFYLLGMRTSL